MRNIVSPFDGNRSPFGNRASVAALSAFSPLSLSPTVWYDPSDSATVFTSHSAEAAVGDPVFIALDKSQGLALGSEQVPDASTWTGSANWTIDTGAGRATVVSATDSGDNLNLGLLTGAYVGQLFRVTMTIESISAGGIVISSSRTSGMSHVTTAGTYTFVLYVTIAGAGALIINVSVGGTTAVVSGITVKELLGYHATQATVAARPPLRASDGIRYLEDDGVDDAINVTLPSLGTDATEVVVTLGAVTINSGLTIGAGVRDVLRDDCVAYLLFDRALTAGEQTQITTWGNGVRGA